MEDNELKNEIIDTFEKKMNKSIIILIMTLITLYFIDFVYKKIKFPTIQINILYHIIQIITIFFIVKVCEKRKIKSIGLYLSNIKKQIINGILLFIMIISLTLIPFIIYRDTSMFNTIEYSIKDLLYFFLYTTLFTTFTEEIVYRGYLLERFNEFSKSDITAIILSSVLFGLSHYKPGNTSNIVGAIIVGLIFSTSKLKFKNTSIISLTLAHTLNNSILAFLGYLSFIGVL